MSTASTGQGLSAAPASGLDWGLMGRQLWGVLRIELRYSLLSRRSLAVTFLAFAPVAIFLLWAFTAVAREFSNGGPTHSMATFAWVFAAYLRTSVFLSSLILFMSLFRGDILQRSLHYYFLAPVRRDVLVLGKYLAAWIAGCVNFVISTTIIYLLVFLPLGFGALGRHLFQGPGIGHLLAYLGVVVLAIAGYGAIFLLAGLFLRNPVVVAILIWGWEWLNFLLPALLKKFSVVFYLQGMYPVPLPTEILSLTADPISVWLSVPGLLLFVLGLLALSAWRCRRMEVNYGED